MESFLQNSTWVVEMVIYSFYSLVHAPFSHLGEIQEVSERHLEILVLVDSSSFQVQSSVPGLSSGVASTQGSLL